MPREMLKLRKGDSAIMIKADGSIELAGVYDKPLIDEKGMLSPVILFASAWVTKEQNLINHLVENFKNCVRMGKFGQAAKDDLENAERAAASATVTQSQPVLKPNMTQEEYDKQKKEEEKLEKLAKEGLKDKERLDRQKSAFMKDAKSIKKEPITIHKEPDLPLEQTFEFQNATPEEQEKMRNTASGAVTLEPVVGTATIEEGVNNENQ